VASPQLYVVDDSSAVRDSLRWLAESLDLEVATFASAADFLAAYVDHSPACLILDVRLRGMSGLALQEELRRRGVGIPTIVMSGHADVPMVVQAMKLGAVDFIQKPFSDQLLIDRVQQVLDADSRAHARDRERAELAARLATLSPREREVMALLAEGKANKEVAAALGLSSRTVEAHRAHLMDKLGIDSVAQLVRIQLAALTSRAWA
jgi:FixJ family two-component response regulator